MKLYLLAAIVTLLSPLFSSSQNYLLSNEAIQFEFETVQGKKLVIAMDTNEQYLVYRYGTSQNIELEYPSSLDSSWNKFQYSWYARGGGIQNEGMHVNYLYFNRESYRYVVFQEFYSRNEKVEYGIKVIHLKTGKTFVIKAKPESVVGTLSVFQGIDKVTIGEELF